MVALLLKRQTSVRALNILGRVDPVVTIIELVFLVAFLEGHLARRAGENEAKLKRTRTELDTAGWSYAENSANPDISPRG